MGFFKDGLQRSVPKKGFPLSLFESFSQRLVAGLSRNDGPLLLVIAGHNGAGKSTCYRKYLREALEPHLENHIDPDAIERKVRAEWSGDLLSDDDFSLMAREEAKRLRSMYLENGIAFSMETVLSDPVGDKVRFLQEAVHRGFFVVLLAVGLDSPEKSRERVALRVSRGGHNVLPEKIVGRYPRVVRNLKHAVGLVSLALVVDNSDDNLDEDGDAYFAFSLFANGQPVETAENIPHWWQVESG